jgi:ribosomal protein L15E
MYLTYTTIKDKTHSDKRTQTNSIKFETSLAPELEATDEYFTDEILMSRKIEYYKEKEVDRKVRELKKFRSITIDDEENYKFKERQKLDKQHQEFEAQAKLQEWVNWVKYNNHTEHGLVCLINYESHEYVTINSIYKLMNIETNKILSSNARDTFIKVQNHINNDGDYGLVDVDYKKDYSISFSKG